MSVAETRDSLVALELQIVKDTGELKAKIDEEMSQANEILRGLHKSAYVTEERIANLMAFGRRCAELRQELNDAAACQLGRIALLRHEIEHEWSSR